MLKEEAEVAKNVSDKVKAWRKKWESKLAEDSSKRDADDAAELQRVETEEWNIKQKVVKTAVDAKL